LFSVIFFFKSLPQQRFHFLFGFRLFFLESQAPCPSYTSTTTRVLHHKFPFRAIADCRHFARLPRIPFPKGGRRRQSASIFGRLWLLTCIF
jgi:hypothetical protein